MASVARDIGLLPPRSIEIRQPQVAAADNPAPALRLPSDPGEIVRSAAAVEARRRAAQRGVDSLRIREASGVTGLFIPGGQR